MTKRVVIRHPGGLKQIVGAISYEADKDVPVELHGVAIEEVVCSVTLQYARPHYLVYQVDLAPTPLAV